MNPTDIETFDHTWNPVTGCENDCQYCFARQAATMGRARNYYPNGFVPEFHPERLEQPLNRKKPTTVFVVDMGDLFGEWVPARWIENVFLGMAHAPQHTYCMLTKNPKRMLEFCDTRPNYWYGASVTGHGDTERIERLLELPAENLFVSFEPLLTDPGNVLELSGIKGVIIGCQTKPIVDVPVPAFQRVIRAAQAVRAKIFIKEPLFSAMQKPGSPYPKLTRGFRELAWQIHKPIKDVKEEPPRDHFF